MAENVKPPLVDATPLSDIMKKKMEFRAEIDTSPPFGSVKEAVTRFGGSGFWIPLHLLREPHHGFEEFDINKVEEHAAKLEMDLTKKEKETLGVLKELELTKRIIEELKLKLQQESSQSEVTPDFDTPSPVTKEMNERTCQVLVGNHEKKMENLSLCPASSLGVILTELQQAKMNLSKTTNDLAVIRTSVGSLNKKAERQKTSVEMNREKLASNPAGKGNSFVDEDELNLTRVKVQQMADDADINKKCFQNPTFISRELEQLNFEAEQFIKMAEAAKSEILRAMSGTEQTKTSMKTAEMRWVAAKKMEEAAKAVEAVALAEMKSLAGSESSSRPAFVQKPEGITVSFEDYASLSHIARKAEGRPNKRAALDAMLRIDEANISKLAILRKLEEATHEVKHTKNALEDAFNRVEVANKRILATEEAVKKWGPDQHYQKAQQMCNPDYESFRPFDLSKPNQVNDDKRPVLRPSISVGEILGRKQILGEEYVAIKRMEGENERQKVSLSQMLNRQRSVASSPTRCEKDRSHDLKHFFAKSKKFGFIHLSIPLTKQSKMQASKLR